MDRGAFEVERQFRFEGKQTEGQVVSVDKYLRKRNLTHTHTTRWRRRDEGEVEANDTEGDWREGDEQYTKEINTSGERGHNLSLEYGTAPDWTCEMGGLEDLEREGRVNWGLC